MDRRSFLGRGGRALLAAAAAPVLGAGILENCNPADPRTWGEPPWTGPRTTTTTTTTTTTLPPRVRALAGYNVFSFAVARADAVQGVYDMAPGLVRWFVEWDRYQPDGSMPVDWTSSRPFFKALQDVGASLYVQLWVQYLVPAWARTATYRNVPRPGTYEKFVEDLESVLGEYGIDVIWGMYNEADLRFGLQNIDGSMAPPGAPVENYHSAWTLNPLDPLRGSALWTGGSGPEWDRLHASPTRTHTSSGLSHRGWIERTSGHYDIADIHLYMVGRDLAWYLETLRRKVALWDSVRPGLPFVVGEVATESHDAPGLSNDTPQEKRLIRERHEAAAGEWGDRYLGMLSLSTGAPWNGSVGWWQA